MVFANYYLCLFIMGKVFWVIKVPTVHDIFCQFIAVCLKSFEIIMGFFTVWRAPTMGLCLLSICTVIYRILRW